MEYLSQEVVAQIEKFRIQYGIGKAFASIFSDGLVVPWKPLPLDEYLRYSELQRQRQEQAEYLSVLLEDEIFQSCVLNNTVKKQADYLKAGVVQSVVHDIWQASSPSDVNSLNEAIEHRRQQTWNAHNAILHEFVKWITLAFPYKPEEVYAMSFDEMCKVLILAEQKLMLMGLLEKPFAALLDTEDDGARGHRLEKKMDPKEVWETVHGIKPPSEPENRQQQEQRLEKIKRLSQQDDSHHEQQAAQFSMFDNQKPPVPTPNQIHQINKRRSWRQAVNELRAQQRQHQPEAEPVLLSPEQLPPEVLNDPNVSPIIKYGGRKDHARTQGSFVAGPDGKIQDPNWLKTPIKIDLPMEERKQLGLLSGHELQDVDIERAKMVEEAQRHYADVLKYLDERRAAVAAKKQQGQKQQGKK